MSSLNDFSAALTKENSGDGNAAYEDVYQSDSRDTGTVNLCIELVRDALVCIKYANEPRRSKTKGMMIDLFDTLIWLESESNRVFTFHFCCEYLGFNRDKVREGLLAHLPSEEIMRENLKLKNFIGPDIHNRGRKVA